MRSSGRRGAIGVVDDYAAIGRPWGFPVEEITVPVRCWHGTADNVVPFRHSDDLVRRVPGAQLTSWDGESHLAVVEYTGEGLDALMEIVR